MVKFKQGPATTRNSSLTQKYKCKCNGPKMMPRKVKKSVAQRKANDNMEEDRQSQASMLEDTQPTDPEQSHDANLGIILKEL